MAGDRIQQADRIGIASEVALGGLVDEAVIHDFLEIKVGQLTAHRKQGAQRLGRDADLVRRHRRQGRNILEAMHPRDLFDQVFLDLDIETVARRSHREVVAMLSKGQRESGKDLRDLRRL